MADLTADTWGLRADAVEEPPECRVERVPEGTVEDGEAPVAFLVLADKEGAEKAEEVRNGICYR